MWKITQDPWHGKTYSKELRIWLESVNQFHSLLQKATPSWKWEFLAVGLWGIYAHMFSVAGINSYNMRKNHPDLQWFDFEMIQRWRLCHCILTFSWGMAFRAALLCRAAWCAHDQGWTAWYSRTAVWRYASQFRRFDVFNVVFTWNIADLGKLHRDVSPQWAERHLCLI